MEEDEFFDVTLVSSDSIDLVGGNTRVIITDNDGKAEPGLACASLDIIATAMQLYVPHDPLLIKMFICS